MKIDAAEHRQIAQAIEAAESRTSGEIFCILARRSGDYRETALAWAVAVAFFLPLALIPLGLTPDRLPLVGQYLGGGWVAGHSSATERVAQGALFAYAMAQAAAFVLVVLAFSIPAVKRATTPKGLKRHHVRTAAMEQFMARGLHLTRERTGVLIYASTAERMVEIIADEGIHAKVGQAHWAEVASGLTKAIGEGRPGAGFVEAIGRCGQVLAEHFPPGADNPNELPDKLVEI